MAAAGSVAATLIANIQSRVAFVHGQVALGISMDTLLANQCHAIIGAIGHAGHINLDDCNRIGEEVSSGPWNDQQKLAIAGALSDAASQLGVPTGPRPQQNCNGIHNYFTDSDWTCFESTEASLRAKSTTMANRLWRIGITCPSEKLICSVTSLLVAAHQPGSSMDP
eukprot:9140559-Pyramimonas_sp.AAC.1